MKNADKMQLLCSKEHTRAPGFPAKVAALPTSCVPTGLQESGVKLRSPCSEKAARRAWAGDPPPGVYPGLRVKGGLLSLSVLALNNKVTGHFNSH